MPRDLEALISGHLLAWLGGLAILLGVVFFLSLAFSRGWIGPSLRVVIGLVAGVMLVGAGAWFFDRKEALFGHVLVAVGLGIVSISLFASTRLYDLVRVEYALAGALVAALAAAAISIRANTQSVAAYGLIAALAAPPLLGAGPAGTTIAYASIILIGTTTIALYRSWRWLPPLAFLLSFPQLSDWIVKEQTTAVALAALGCYWLLNAIAAGGEEFRVRRNRLSVSSTTLLVADAAFLVFGGFVVLDGALADWRGAFLVVAALAHFALGGYFLRAEGDHHPFGMLAFGTGVAALSMAVPVQLGGPYVPIAWAAEATALAWVCADRRHGYSGLVSLALAALAVGHLVTIEYPWRLIGTGQPSHYPFVNAAGGTLGFLLAAIAVAAYFFPVRALRAALGNAGLLLVSYALPFELSGLPLLAAWSALVVAGAAFQYRLVPLLPHDPEWEAPGGEHALASMAYGLLAYVSGFVSASAALVAGVLAVGHAFTFDLPPHELGGALPATPFTDHYTLAAAILIAAALLAGFVVGHSRARQVSYLAALAVAAYLMPFELGDAATVVAWAVLSLGLGLLARRAPSQARLYLEAAAVLTGLALLQVFATVAPPSRLFVHATSSVDHPILWSGATAALGAVIVVLLTAYWAYRQTRWHLVLGVLVGALALYLLSVGLVDEFQRRVGGTTSLESLQKQAQVGLSILWAAAGGTVFAAGILRQSSAARLVGLTLLGLTTVKVFVYDLASLDVAYRVPSFIALGVLLLLSAYLYQHFTPTSREPETGARAGWRGWFGGRGGRDSAAG